MFLKPAKDASTSEFNKEWKKKKSLQEIDGFLILTSSKLWEKVEIYG